MIAAALAARGGADAQTGNFVLTDGAGVGKTVTAAGGVVIGPGATNGNLSAEHGPTCPGPAFHFHGTLLGNPDPDAAGCGWGHVNFSSMVTPPTPATTTPSLNATTPSISLVPGPVAKPFFTPQSTRDVLALQSRNGPATGALFTSPPALDFSRNAFIIADARHALSHSPRPVPRPSEKISVKPTRAVLWDFLLTGPEAKLKPSRPDNQP